MVRSRSGLYVALLAAFVVAVSAAAVVVNLAVRPRGDRPGAGHDAGPDTGLVAEASRPSVAPQISGGAGTAAPSAPVVDPAWVSRTAAATGISPTAMAAYGNATLRLARDQPSCHLGWTTLVGIGTVESANGTIGGRTLGTDGYSSRPIRGPALNGVGYAAMRDGDEWAHALGPMQFLRSSWDRWGADGDGDGRADADDLFDAALAAARYLCADGSDLRTGTGWTAAVRSYNHSDTYVREVYDHAVAAGNAAGV